MVKNHRQRQKTYKQDFPLGNSAIATKLPPTRPLSSNCSVRLTTHFSGWFERGWFSDDPWGTAEPSLQQAYLTGPYGSSVCQNHSQRSDNIQKAAGPLTSLCDLSFSLCAWLLFLTFSLTLLHTAFFFCLTCFSLNTLYSFHTLRLFSLVSFKPFSCQCFVLFLFQRLSLSLLLSSCVAVCSLTLCQPGLWCQRPWAHQEKAKWGRQTERRGGGSRSVTSRQVQTHARLMWCTVGGGCTPKCLRHAFTLLTCKNKLGSGWRTQAVCTRLGWSLYTSVHLQLSQVSDPSSQSLHKTGPIKTENKWI